MAPAGDYALGEFSLDDIRYEIWEPFGDSSRYWIGPARIDPAEVVPTAEVVRVRDAFARASMLAGLRASAG